MLKWLCLIFLDLGAERARRSLWLALAQGEHVQGELQVLGARLRGLHLPLLRAEGHAGEGGGFPWRGQTSEAQEGERICRRLAAGPGQEKASEARI